MSTTVLSFRVELYSIVVPIDQAMLFFISSVRFYLLLSSFQRICPDHLPVKNSDIMLSINSVLRSLV